MLSPHICPGVEADGMLCSVNPPIQNTSVQIASEAFTSLFPFLFFFFFLWAVTPRSEKSSRLCASSHYTWDISWNLEGCKSDPTYMRIFRYEQWKITTFPCLLSQKKQAHISFFCGLGRSPSDRSICQHRKKGRLCNSLNCFRCDGSHCSRGGCWHRKENEEWG